MRRPQVWGWRILINEKTIKTPILSNDKNQLHYHLLINILSIHMVKYCHFTKAKIIIKWLSFNANK